MAHLPSGAITFLFTDIEGSTRLLKQLRERYGEVLAEHQRLLRAAFAAHGGYEIDTQGDSFFVAFVSAREAVLAAVEGQRALLAHAWPDGIQVRVRMGLHTGQAVASDGRYTGLAVHRAARIAAAGHGGQVLVSQATQTLLEDEEEDLLVSLHDLGEQRLKDLDRPVRLYQAAADGLPTTFPPLRHEAELARAAEAAIEAPPWRRPRLVAAVALALVVLAAAAVFVGTRDSTGGLSKVRPNHVGVIDPKANEIIAEIPVGVTPGPIAAGAGSVWVGNLDDKTISRIDVERRAVVRTFQLENRTPTGIAVRADAVWVAHGRLGEVSLVDPQFGQVTETIAVGDTAFGSSTGAVALAGDSVWVVFGDSTLARLDADGNVRGRTLAGSQPAALVVASGSVWVANSGDSTVQRFNSRSFEEGPIRDIPVGPRPTGIAAGEGSIWVTNSGEAFVTRIDPSSSSVRPIAVDERPTAVAVGDGAVWVASAAAGMIWRIDPQTNQVVNTIDVGNAPAELVIADGVLWVTVQER